MKQMNEKARSFFDKVKQSKFCAKLKEFGIKIKESKLYNKLKDKTPPRVKTFIKDYKKMKSLSVKQKILHIVPIVVVTVVFLVVCFSGRGLGGSSAISTLYSKSALPYDVQSQVNAGVGLYENVSYGVALDYMFKNPSVKTKKDDGDTLVTISGNYRWQTGGSYSSYGEITFRITGGGSVIVEEDSYNVENAMRNIALELGKKY